ncbi:MAG TPA: arsenate reductase ArsC [Bacilli bacterium]|nr:arsenate reductase ArsC [Bacilli bacterium]
MKKNIAFVCVHNSCRSQIAEAFGKLYLSKITNVYSAGTILANQINQDAIRLMRKLYDIDLEKTQKPKLISSLPKIDYLITMGCNVECPLIPCKVHLDWGIEDPTYFLEEKFIKTIKMIEKKVLSLKVEIKKHFN